MTVMVNEVHDGEDYDFLNGPDIMAATATTQKIDEDPTFTQFLAKTCDVSRHANARDAVAPSIPHP